MKEQIEKLGAIIGSRNLHGLQATQRTDAMIRFILAAEEQCRRPLMEFLIEKVGDNKIPKTTHEDPNVIGSLSNEAFDKLSMWFDNEHKSFLDELFQNKLPKKEAAKKILDRVSEINNSGERAFFMAEILFFSGLCPYESPKKGKRKRIKEFAQRPIVIGLIMGLIMGLMMELIDKFSPHSVASLTATIIVGLVVGLIIATIARLPAYSFENMLKLSLGYMLGYLVVLAGALLMLF